jgi:hypothetical protein
VRRFRIVLNFNLIHKNIRGFYKETRPTQPDDTFTRMFTGLPALAPATDEMWEKEESSASKGASLTRWIT